MLRSSGRNLKACMHKFSITLAVALLLAPGLLFASGERLTPFSALPTGPVEGSWELVELKGQTPTEFSIVEQDGQRVLEARAVAAAAALAHKIDVPVDQPAILHWRWKIAAYVDGADINTKKGDDYPARIYVTFARDAAKLPWLIRLKLRLAKLIYGTDVPTAAICYVWDKNSPVGRSVPNVYTSTVQMIVVRDGTEDVDTWISESRDVYADYRRAFGGEPPPVSSIIVGVDTDNTGESVTAWFGDLYFASDDQPQAVF
jgi:hypothetical protein